MNLRAHSWRLLRVILPSARSIRMSLYAVFVFGVLALAAARSVRADVRELGLDVGHQLAKLEDLTGEGYTIRVNGAVLHRASAHTALSVHDVLGRYETYCKTSPGALSHAMQDIPGALADRIELPESPAMRAAVLRDESGGRGMLVCFVDDDKSPRGALVERLQAASSSGDLSKLGHFRYAFAEPSKGPNAQTHVVTFWSDGELALKTMFPAYADAPGGDGALAPRPPGSRRTLSASVDGYPASVHIYESTSDRDTLVRVYDASLLSQGFVKIAAPGVRGGAGYLGPDNAEIIVSITSYRGRTSVTVVESKGSSATVHAEVLP